MNTSILDNDSAMRHTRHDCGGTILTGAPGTAQEHEYCDRCDWVEFREDADEALYDEGYADGLRGAEQKA
jgi:hypothetical protein